VPEPPDESIVLVPVPVEHLAAVYELISRLMAPTGQAVAQAGVATATATGGQARVDSGQVLVDDDQGYWNEEMVTMLRIVARERQTLDGAIDLIAASAPDPIWLDDIQSVLNVPRNHLRAEFATLSKISRSLFGGRKTWPMSWRAPRTKSETQSYRMPKEVAAWWRGNRQPWWAVHLRLTPTGRRLFVTNIGSEMAFKPELIYLRDVDYRDQPLELQVQGGFRTQLGDMLPGTTHELPMSYVRANQLRVVVRWADMHTDLTDVVSVSMKEQDLDSVPATQTVWITRQLTTMRHVRGLLEALVEAGTLDFGEVKIMVVEDGRPLSVPRQLLAPILEAGADLSGEAVITADNLPAEGILFIPNV